MKKPNVLLVLTLVIVVTLAGCNKADENQSDSIKISPVVNKSLEGYENIIEEVDKLLDYVYLDGDKPTENYMEHIDNLIDERENQRLYMDNFLEELDRISKEILGDIVQEGGNTVGWEDETNVEDDYYEMPVEQLENSEFIQTDDNGRDYIDIKDLEFFTDDVLFRYNNSEYMLDMSEYKPTMKTIKLQQRHYKFIYGAEVDDETIEMAYLDTAGGTGKTITVTHSNGKIRFIDFEL